MKTFIFLICNILISCLLVAQAFETGQTSVTFIDPDRSNRNISTEIFYPSNTAGTNVPVAEGVFPVLSFGHGFLMNYDAYSIYWETLIPQGYIMVFPKTETGFSPSHPDFGLDLAFLIRQMKAEGADENSMFYQKIAEESSIMGHSMGGGCSFLGAETDTTITAIITFAASAATNPPAFPAAHNLEIPALVFAGQNDSVTPSWANQLPLYDTLLSTCKTYININGGSHCYFGNENQICDFGELLSGSNPTISREEQHEVVFTFLGSWLEYTLKGDVSAFANFQDSLYASSRITFLHDCLTTSVNNPLFQNDWVVFPNPFSDMLKIRILNDKMLKMLNVSFFDWQGKQVFEQNSIPENEISINLQSLPDGLYLVRIITTNGDFTRKVMKKTER